MERTAPSQQPDYRRRFRAGLIPPRQRTIPSCHPERKHAAKGLCRYCWRKSRQHEWNDNLKYKYGLTIASRDQMLKDQQGLCKLCGEQLLDDRRRYCVVEHNHKTGKVRGLVHQRCNTLIGYVENFPELIQRATAYLAEEN